MENLHRYYLSLGSNIEPEKHLREAIVLLGQYGTVTDLSSVWESHPLGGIGPNYLNVCAALEVAVSEPVLKTEIIASIEAVLGRTRTNDRNAPRTIDIDILMEDDRPLHHERWEHPFVVVPLAELVPARIHPTTGRRLEDEAEMQRVSTWIRRHPLLLRE